MLDPIVLKYTNNYSRFVVLNKALVHYRDEGEGEPLLLLHGAFSSLHTFDGWVADLKEDYRVVRYDLLGFGLTGKQLDGDYTVKNQIKTLLELLDLLHIEQCILCGSSMGGWFAWEFALQYPERVRKLILLDASGFLGEDSIPLPFKISRLPFAQPMMKLLARKTLTAQFLEQVFYDTSVITTETVQRYYDLSSLTENIEAFSTMVKKTPYQNNTHNLIYLKCPTLILWGKEDRWIPLNDAYRFVRLIPNAKLIVYEEVGHLPMEEIITETLQDFKDFIKG